MGRKKEIMLLVTYSCNLNCVYCYEPKTMHKVMTSDKAKSYIKDVVDNLDESYSEFEVQFMGGEPLLQFELIKNVSEWLCNQTFKIKLSQIFVVTNGTLLNEEMKSWFSSYKDKICLGLSFDGDFLMQNTNRSSSAPLVDLAYFVNNWPDQQVKMTVSPSTINYMYDGVTFLTDCGFTSITTDLAMGNKIVWTDQHISSFAEQLDELVCYYVKNPTAPLFSMFNMDLLSVLTNKSDNAKKCGCGEDLVCVDTDGKHYACHLFSPITLDSTQLILSKNLDFTNHEYFAIPDCKDCAIEQLCPHCYGMNYLCTGNIRNQSAFTCKSSKIQFTYACKCQLGRALKNGDMQLYSTIVNIINKIQL